MQSHQYGHQKCQGQGSTKMSPAILKFISFQFSENEEKLSSEHNKHKSLQTKRNYTQDANKKKLM